jgi:hypothetical protein
MSILGRKINGTFSLRMNEGSIPLLTTNVFVHLEGGFNTICSSSRIAMPQHKIILKVEC